MLDALRLKKRRRRGNPQPTGDKGIPKDGMKSQAALSKPPDPKHHKAPELKKHEGDHSPAKVVENRFNEIVADKSFDRGESSLDDK